MVYHIISRSLLKYGAKQYPIRSFKSPLSLPYHKSYCHWIALAAERWAELGCNCPFTKHENTAGTTTRKWRIISPLDQMIPDKRFSVKKYFDGVFITRVAVCVCLCACERVWRGMILTCPLYFENKNIILPGKRNAVTERKKYLVDWGQQPENGGRRRWRVIWRRVYNFLIQSYWIIPKHIKLRNRLSKKPHYIGAIQERKERKKESRKDKKKKKKPGNVLR